jgi:MFS family permease
MHGRVLALQVVLLVGTAPIGGPFLGWLADAWNARAPIFIGAIACLGGAAWAWAAGRRARADELEALRAEVAPEPVDTELR